MFPCIETIILKITPLDSKIRAKLTFWEVIFTSQITSTLHSHKIWTMSI